MTSARRTGAQIATGPFHAVKWGIQKHNTIGGVTINAKAQVMDWSSQVIPGLYAAGESAGGMDLIGLPSRSCSAARPASGPPGADARSPAPTSVTLKADHASLMHGKSVLLTSILSGAHGTRRCDGQLRGQAAR